ncbi:MAG: hypothetical protein R8M70_00055 [Alphaproteobacteria bacterium]|nr:hypothetical protein [Alphaproteobacteria bacterium]
MVDVEILDKCTLLQACEWIALQWEPMSDLYEQYDGRIRPQHPLFAGLDLDITTNPTIDWDKYKSAITKAKAALKIALIQAQLVATGTYIPEHTDESMRNERDDIEFQPFFTLDVNNNRFLLDGKPIYTNICIDFTKLLSVFPGINRKQKNTYKSDYMQLMDEVINQEHITNKNQSKKTVLKDIIIQKMKEKKMRPSDKLAGAMATLIRQPSSQGGRNKKG